MDRERERRLKELDKAGAIEGAQIAQGEIAQLSQEQRNNLQQEKMVLSQQTRERELLFLKQQKWVFKMQLIYPNKEISKQPLWG